MNKKLLKVSIAASLLLSSNLLAQEELSAISVSSSFLKTNELSASYATEIYTKEDIEKFKSKDLYDFLNMQTSLNIAPSYGNTFAPRIDLRGYGIGDGYQNLVIAVNGRRLNNIDMNPQLISSIPLESIEKIEIIKGSGSVEFGDGVNAGVVNIITNGKNDNFVKANIGSNGHKGSTLSFGFDTEKFVLNGFVDYLSNDGNRKLSNGEENDEFNRNRKVDLKFFPYDDIELRLGRSFNNMKTVYGSSLSLEQYKKDPAFSLKFTEQKYNTYNTNLGLTYDISNKYKMDFDYNNEDKESIYTSDPYISKYKYEHESYSLKLNANFDRLRVLFGSDGFDGDRTSSGKTTTKENKAIFTSLEYLLNSKTSFKAGARRENVEYTHDTGLNQDNNLSAYDFGFNYKIDENNSIFANYNRSFQAPDVDRFFLYSGGFNGFIDPAIVKTINIGYNNIQKSNKLKVTLFRSNLTNEIYYYNAGGVSRNTNIDKSHKYGLELFNKYLINKNLYTSFNYTYLIAKIDEEDEGNGAYNGKDLPGVSKHNLTVNLGYNINNFSTILSHTYRSSAYAAQDFDNNNNQKQEVFNSTDLTFAYTYKNIELFTKIQNLFDEDNALWIADDNIYPVNFERTFLAGIKVKF